MSTESRLAKLEAALAPAETLCTHGAVIRLIGDHVSDEERRRFETPEICRICGMTPIAQINLIALPTGMTLAEWQANRQQ